MARFSDELVKIRTHFFVGNYEAVVSDATTLKTSSPEAEVERVVFLTRAKLALGKHEEVVLSKDAHPELQALVLLTQSLKSESQKERALVDLKEFLSNETHQHNSVVQLIAATIFCNSGLYEEALRLLHQGMNIIEK